MVSDREEFAARIYAIVSDIPEGYVLSYGMLALLAGRPNNSRLVGKIMSRAPRDLSSHRVVNHSGRIVTDWPQQREYLEQEGVTFKKNGCVDMKKHLWRSM